MHQKIIDRLSNCGPITASALRQLQFEPTNWIIPGILPEGLGLLAGKPKVGKSWWVLDLCNSVAEGLNFMGRATKSGDVLYLALEDTRRRLKARLELMDMGAERLTIETEMPRMPDLMRSLELWAAGVQNPKLIVIDTLGLVRPLAKPGGDIYDDAYAALTPLKDFAETWGICVLVIHHTRKSGSDGDPLDAVSGSMGQAGAADTVIILEKERIIGRGREVVEFEFDVYFNDVEYRWQFGEAEGTLNAIAQAIEDHAPALIFRGSSLMEHCPEGTTDAHLRAELSRCVKSGKLMRVRNGYYQRTEI